MEFDTKYRVSYLVRGRQLLLCLNTVIDVLGVRITVGSFIILGKFERMRDVLASALTHWTEDMHLYPYIMGL